MADLDQLSIQIESDAKKAEDAINSLISGLNNLNDALKGLDVSKITAFTNAVSKLSNIGSTTNTTSKALRGMSNQLSKTFGIKSKEGIKDLNVALNDFYEATKRSSKDSSLPTQQMYVDSAKALHKAITENASYKKELRDDVRIVKDFYDAQKANGSVFSLKGYKDLFDDKTWAEYKKSLGSVFTFKKFSNEQGVGDIENFFSSLYKRIPDKAFFSDTQNPLDTAEAIKTLVDYLDEARNSTLRYKEAVDSQVISGNEAKEGVIAIGEQLKTLVREQNEFSGENGLKGVVSAMQALGSVKLPDMTGVADAVKALNSNPPSNTAKAVADIGNSASSSAKQVEELAGKLDKVQRVIEGNEIKDYQRGFTMKDAPTTPNIEYPPAVIQTVTEQAQAFQEKLLPAVVDTVNVTNELYSRMSDTSAVESAYDALYEKILDIKRAMFEGGATNEKWLVPEQGQNPSFNRESLGFISDIKSSDAQDYFYKIEDTAKGTALAIRDVGTTALALADQFKPVEEAMKNAFDNQKVEELKNTVDSIPSDPLNNVAESAKKVISPIEQALETMREMKKLISGMESGKTPFDLEDYQEAIKMYDQASKKVGDFKKSLSEQPKSAGMADVIENLVALGEALEKVSQKFGMLANTGIKIFKGLVTPLKWAANEYVEKFENMKTNLDGFVKRFQKGMDKISQFWKRTMKTFTFMVVRKVFTAIIKEVGNAVQSLAIWSNAMGTAFNNDISLMVADFQYLGRSIISVFAPLLNTIAPIIDALVDKIAELISYIGMLFAALGGGTSFTKAKKNVTNYAESLDSASKSAKNLTMGIDELNILNDNKGGGGAKPYDGWEDAWEQVEIPAWILNLSDFFKKLWDDFFAPLKKAWERAKQYLIDGFKTMINSIKQLLADIGRDFLEMWNQEKTIRMFEQILKIFGDLMRVVRELANNFDEAWNKGQFGLRIFKNLRDIAAILVDHVRNVSYYMIGWAKEIDFSPMLKSFEKMTKKLKPLADFVGGVFEDVMKDGILKYIEFLIKDAIPHLEDTIGEIADAFSFKKMRKQLKPLWAEIEEMFENIHTGITSTIGNIGKEIAKFTNSRTFEMFLQNIIDLTNEITSARVEKVLTGLAQGILAIAKAVVDFVNSDIFQGFIKFIGDWIDKHSSDDIAGILTKIAGAIAVFKFVEFTTGKLSGFFNFLTTLTAMKNLVNIASDLGHLSGRITEVGVAASTHKITSYAEGFSLLGTKIVNLPSALGSLGTAFLDLHNHIGLVTKTLGSVFVGFEEFKNVSKYVENLTLALNGDDSKSLNGSLLGLVATVGIAGAAFTALLGFPAGLIATGVVGAIAAIKGIQEAIDKINFQHISDAVLTQGEMTVGEVKGWYSDTTNTILEHTQKWKEAERNLTQDREDINEYTRAIEGLTAAFSANGQVTVGMADELVGKYKDLGTAINSYIDESTNALVTNLLAQKEYLQTQGYDVDQMILNIYQTADAQKNAVGDSLTNLEQAATKYSEMVDEFGYDSKEAQDALTEYKNKVKEASDVTKQYSEEISKVNSEEAVKQIEALGKSIDWSQYKGKDGVQEAINDINGSIKDITAAYKSGMDDLKTTRDDEIDEWNKQFAKGMIDEETKQANILSTQKAFAEASDALTNATRDTLNLYQSDLVTKIQNVAKKAAEEWENGGAEVSGLTKAEYINQLVQEFLNKTIGEDGLEGSINELYNALPGKVNNNVVTAMTDIVNDQWEAYSAASEENGSYSYAKAQNFDMLQGILNQTNDLDYDTPSSTFATSSWNTIMGYARGLPFDEYGQVMIGGASKSVLDSKIDFENANRLVSGEGANAMTDEYKQKIQPLADSMSELGLTAGENLDLGLVEGVRKQDAQSGLKTEIENLFKNANDWIHNNTWMPFGSPNKKTTEYGEDIVNGLNIGITKNASSSITAIGTWFVYINAAVKNKLGEVKTTFNTMLTGIFSGTGWDYNSPITTLFTNVTSAISNNLTVLGTTMIGTMLPEFVNNYLKPFFSSETWQPLFDSLTNDVLSANFDSFTEWFSTSMNKWWSDGLTSWFKIEKWNNEIFTPIQRNIEKQFTTFSNWWDKSIKSWWEDKTMPYFKVSFWNEQVYSPLEKNRLEKFKGFMDWWQSALKSWWDEKSMPYFKTNFWDEKIFTPLEKNRLSHYKKFIEWWTSSIKNWWEEKTMPYFEVAFWDEQIYKPLKESLLEHFKKFMEWWDESIKDWWNNHLMPYFKPEKWKEQFDNIKAQAELSFSEIKKTISDNIKEAEKAVSDACKSMGEDLDDLLEKIQDVADAFEDVGDIEGVSLDSDAKFAGGGYPTMGSLFLAGENGAGAELVGNVNGKTGVVSNGEITGISDAVYATGNQESELLTQLLQVAQSLLDKDPVVISDRQIAQMAQNGQSQMGMSIIS